ncbi:MAG: polymer-forming cytoskeletal protein [Proteobacteria bacterium]|nr:polymer-forming cytoskeletal protein [Pseudomonadota bacterium]
MAISGFGRGKDDTGSSTGSSPAPSVGISGGLTAFIDQGSEFEGKLSFKDTVRIDGHFSGEISSQNTLMVGETGEIEARIESKTVVVAGSVMGDVIASRQIVIHKSGRVHGNLETPSLVVEEGAVFNGTIKMERPDARGRGEGSGQGGAPLKAVAGGAEKPKK